MFLTDLPNLDILLLSHGVIIIVKYDKNEKS